LVRAPALALTLTAAAVILDLLAEPYLNAWMLAALPVGAGILGLLAAGAGGRGEKTSIAYSITAPVNARLEEIQEDLDRLNKFSVERSKKGLLYTMVSLSAYGRRGTYLVVTGSGDMVEGEEELLEAFARSLKALRLRRVVNAPWGRRIVLRLPGDNGYALHQIHPQRSLELVYPRTSLSNVEDPGILLGYAVGSDEPIPVGLEPEDLFRHVGVFGSTGSGKTTTAARIALEAAKAGLNVVVIDWHEEYKEILPGASFLRPCDAGSGPALDPFGEEASIEEAVDIVEQVLNLTPPQAYMLHRVLEEHGGRLSVEELASYLEASTPDQGYWEREVRQALLRRLHVLLRGSKIGLFKRNARGVEAILADKLSVIQVGCIDNTSLRTLYVLFLLKLLFKEARRKGGLRAIVVVDEAHNVFKETHTKTSFAEKLIAESRKYLLGFVIVTQSPSSIASSVLKNTGTKVVHSIRSGIDKKIIGSSLSLSREHLDLLGYLRPGEAVVQTPLIPEPLVARIIPPGLREDPVPARRKA